jgi:hypothetical protein
VIAHGHARNRDGHGRRHITGQLLDHRFDP